MFRRRPTPLERILRAGAAQDQRLSNAEVRELAARWGPPRTNAKLRRFLKVMVAVMILAVLVSIAGLFLS
jgi:hypothetical protein